MALARKVQLATALISLSLLISTHLCFSSDDVHDLLPTYNLPKGLLPQDIKSYSLSATDNAFTVELSSKPCYVKFNDQVVYYDNIIKGKLGYGKVTEVSGIQAKKLFFWVSVTGIDVDEKNGIIQFHVGALSQELPEKDFEEIRSCKAKGVQESTFLEAMIENVNSP